MTRIHVKEGQSVLKGQVLFETEAVEGGLVDDFDLGSELIATADFFDMDPGDIEAFIAPYVFEAGMGDSGTYLGYVTSPCEGLVTSVKVSEGSLVSSTTHCVSVSTLKDLQVRVSISEGNIQSLLPGMPVDISGEAFKGRVFKGVLVQISPVARQLSSLTDSGETVIDALIAVKHPDGSLRPGYTANVKIFTSKKEKTMTIPYECIIQERDNTQSVFIISDGRCYKRTIFTGDEMENAVEVLSGLLPGQQVISSNLSKLSDGMRVSVQ